MEGGGIRCWGCYCEIYCSAPNERQVMGGEGSLGMGRQFVVNASLMAAVMVDGRFNGG